jgi:hypothetical protein
MTRTPARSLPAAERRALVGENDSQDSQEKLLFLIKEHGVGVVSGRNSHQDPNKSQSGYLKLQNLLMFTIPCPGHYN